MIEGGSQVYLKKTYDCPGYGADAVRYTLLDMTTEGQDLKLSPAKFETGRNFANKVWNAGRFLLMNLAERQLAGLPSPDDLANLKLGFPERWILDRLQAATQACTAALDAWRFNDYANGAYRFFRDDLCDWYLEWAKHEFKQGDKRAETAAKVLSHCFEQVLRLLHPGMPFITEYLWQLFQPTIGGRQWSGRFLMTEAWPEVAPALVTSSVHEEMSYLQDIVRTIRNVRNLAEISDSEKLLAGMHWRSAPGENADNFRKAKFIGENLNFVLDRGNLSDFSTGAMGTDALRRDGHAIIATVREDQLYVMISKSSLNVEAFKTQLTKRRGQVEKSISGKQGRLANSDYIARAPVEQVAETRMMLAKEEVELANLIETLGGL